MGPYGGFPDFGYLDPSSPEAPYQLLGAQSGNFGLTPLGHSTSRPPGYDRYGQHCHSSFLYLQTRRDPSPLSVTSSSGSFLRLHSQDIVLGARHIAGYLNVIIDRLSRPNQPITTEWSLHPEIVIRIFETWGFPTVDTHLPQLCL